MDTSLRVSVARGPCQRASSGCGPPAHRASTALAGRPAGGPLPLRGQRAPSLTGALPWPRTVDAHRVVHRCGVAPRPQGGLPVQPPLEGAGLVLGLVGRLTLPCRPVELHPLDQLLLTAVFEHLAGFKIDLHGVAFPAREARLWGVALGVKKEKISSEVFF
jgi:hypothetical protein